MVYLCCCYNELNICLYVGRMILFSVTEICHILGVSQLEYFLLVSSYIPFTILLCLYHEGLVLLTAAKVFIPLFVYIALHWYLATIVLVRRLRLGMLRPAVIIPRYVGSLFSIMMMLTTQILLVQRLDSHNTDVMLYLEIFVPLLLWLVLVALFQCAGCTRQHGNFQPVSFNS